MSDETVNLLLRQSETISTDVKQLLQIAAKNETRLNEHDNELKDLKVKAHDVKSCPNTTNVWWAIKFILIALGIVATVIGGLIIKAFTK